METLWPALLAAVGHFHSRVPGARILVTGHSKGGALVALCSWRLHAVRLTPAFAVSFAGARCGDAAFADAYDAVIPHTRFENHLDLVPFVPPSMELVASIRARFPAGALLSPIVGDGYAPVGQLRHINEQGVVADAPSEANRLKAIRERILDGILPHPSLHQVVTAHFPVRTPFPTHPHVQSDNSYARALCPPRLQGE
jgi:hypothetical protein